MNQMSMTGNMAGFPGHPGLGNMPMSDNIPNGAVGRMGDDHIEEANYEAKLNSLIYGYFFHRGQYDVARSLKESGASFDPPIVHSDNEMNGADNMQTESKDGINDIKPPLDLPDVKGLMNDGQGGPFLLSWFTLFWDVYFAQRKDRRATANASMYVNHTQQQARMRQDQQHQMLQRMPMGPNGVGMGDYGAMMRFPNGMHNDNLQRRALQNRGGLQPTPQQLAQMRSQQQLIQAQNQQQMRRDPSEMDMNGQRPRTPSSSEHAPSPSKRIRMDAVPFNGQPMMPNGRAPPPGMAGQMMGGPAATQANNLLMESGINPGNLSESQFASFQQQNPAVQQKSIQVYAQNLAKNQRQQSMSNAGGHISDQGSPIMVSGLDVGALGPDFYNGNNPTAMQLRGAPPPNVPNGGAGGNHALQDYQMQLMLLEQQNKKRLMMARQEQDTIGGRPDGMPAMPGGPGFPPGMSPSGSRGGPSPGPGDQKRGTPKMNQVGPPGSPMPDGSMRGSPAAMNFNGTHADMYNQMNGNAMRPPSSNPAFVNGQYNAQQMEQMARAQQQAAQGGRMPNTWQQGPQGQAPMIQQPQSQQPAQMGTPQQRNDMPPPQGVPNTTANGRQPSPPAPPTPQPITKANPKGAKKDARDRKKPQKKNSTASVAPTPTSEADNAPPTPTPATPVTSQNAASFAPKNEGQGPQNVMQGIAAPEPLAQQQPDANTIQFNGLEGDNEPYNMAFNSHLDNPDLLENFDFEQFLQVTNGEDFNFDPSAFEPSDGIEAGISGGT